MPAHGNGPRGADLIGSHGATAPTRTPAGTQAVVVPDAPGTWRGLDLLRRRADDDRSRWPTTVVWTWYVSCRTVNRLARRFRITRQVSPRQLRRPLITAALDARPSVVLGLPRSGAARLRHDSVARYRQRSPTPRCRRQEHRTGDSDGVGGFRLTSPHEGCVTAAPICDRPRTLEQRDRESATPCRRPDGPFAGQSVAQPGRRARSRRDALAGTRYPLVARYNRHVATTKHRDPELEAVVGRARARLAADGEFRPPRAGGFTSALPIEAQEIVHDWLTMVATSVRSSPSPRRIRISPTSNPVS